jgi:hypothetical protein
MEKKRKRKRRESKNSEEGRRKIGTKELWRRQESSPQKNVKFLAKPTC